jgi:hypothetical protein
MNLIPAFPKNAAAGVLAPGPATLRGWSIRALTTAVVRLHDGTSATGVFLAEIGVVAAATDNVLDPAGIRAANGVFLEIVSGTVEGAVYFA